MNKESGIPVEKFSREELRLLASIGNATEMTGGPFLTPENIKFWKCSAALEAINIFWHHLNNRGILIVSRIRDILEMEVE